MFSNKKRLLPILLVVLLIGLLTVGGTVAYLMQTTDPVENTFNPNQVTVELHESFNNTTKSDVYVENTCDIPVYVRVALVPVWEDADGNVMGISASIADLEIDWGDNWKQNGGYWYYTKAVPAKDVTDDLIESATVKTANGYKLNLQILVEAIQADGTNGTQKAVVNAWGVDPTGL